MILNEKSEKDYKGVYGLEITTTNACNYNCSYCFERNHILEERLLDAKILIKRIHELLDAEWFKDQYSGIKIVLWGENPP
jgi:sulfatase maturation enzyme AslB (radical SAM superfamily)